MRKITIKELQQAVACHRDEDAYKKIFIGFYQPLLHFANSLVKNMESSEEIVSDVMMNIWEMQEALDRVIDLKVYLYRAVKNRSLNHLTRNQKYTIWDIENLDVAMDPSLYSADPENILLNKELKEEIFYTIKMLPPKCQMAYKLVREDGLSYKEVAGIMDISIKTVDRHLNNALHKLVSSLKVNSN